MNTEWVWLLSSVPNALISLAALALAVARFERHPTVSALVLASTLIGFLVTVSYFLLPRFMNLGAAPAGMDMQWVVMGINGLLSALSHGLLVAAAFASRDKGDGQVQQRW